MNAEFVKKETLTCSNCGHIINLNAWGIPKASQYDGALKRARERLKKETGFGIKEKKWNQPKKM